MNNIECDDGAEGVGCGNTSTEFLQMCRHARHAIAASGLPLERQHSFRINWNFIHKGLLSINILIQQPTLVQMAAKCAPLEKKKEEVLTTKIMEIIALYMHSYSIVENHDFTALIEEAIQSHVILSRTTLFHVTVLRLYHDKWHKAHQELTDAFGARTSARAFTCNMRTSNANHSLVLALHHDWVWAKTVQCATRHVLQSRAALDLCMLLYELCTEWNIPSDAIIFVIACNGRNIRAAGKQLPWKECARFAHTFQLDISDAVPQVPGSNELYRKVQTVEVHYKHNLSTQKCLDDLLFKMGEPICMCFRMFPSCSGASLLCHLVWWRSRGRSLWTSLVQTYE